MTFWEILQLNRLPLKCLTSRDSKIFKKSSEKVSEYFLIIIIKIFKISLGYKFCVLAWSAQLIELLIFSPIFELDSSKKQVGRSGGLFCHLMTVNFDFGVSWSVQAQSTSFELKYVYIIIYIILFKMRPLISKIFLLYF